MATFKVDTGLDVVDPRDGRTSLREAVLAANETGGADRIEFAGELAGSVLRLTRGQIRIADAVTVDGAGVITITGDARDDDVTFAGTDITDVAASGLALLVDNTRIFDVTEAHATTTLVGLTLTGGRTWAEGAAGGAVRSVAELRIEASTIAGNSTGGDLAAGGGVSGSVVTIARSTIAGNVTSGDGSSGGGVHGAILEIASSTIGGNRTEGRGAEGGGAFGGTMSVTSGTVSGNIAVDASARGGGLAGGELTLTNSIVLGNFTAAPGLIGDEVALDRSLILRGGNIVGGEVLDGGYTVETLSASAEAVFAQTVEIAPDVRAGVLADHGGPVATMALRASTTNPALDLGRDVLADGATDARVLPRPVDQPEIPNDPGRTLDLGAFELDEASPETPGLVVTTAIDVVDVLDGLTSLREAVAHANALPGADTVTFDASLAGVVLRLTQGPIEVSDALTIDGAGVVTISGDAAADDVTSGDGAVTDVATSGAELLDDNTRILVIRSADAITTLAGLTLTGGHTVAEGEGGGAVWSLAPLTIRASTIAGNGTAGHDAPGGAVAGAAVTLIDTTVQGNRTQGNSSYGGGISAAQLTLTNTTVAGNGTHGYRAYGGGVHGTSVILSSSTVSGNTTAGTYASGGGLWAGDLVLANSIVLGNVTTYSAVADDDVRAVRSLVLLGRNIVGGDVLDGETTVRSTTAEEVFETTVELADGVRAGVPGEQGGPTATIALRNDPTNPALDSAEPPLSPATDQRGIVRPQGDGPDLGAFEAVRLGAPSPRDDAAVTTRQRPILVDVLANDDTGGDLAGPPTFETQPAHGTLLLMADHRIAYLPAPGFDGEDGFQYRITGRSGFADIATVVVAVDVPALAIPGRDGPDDLRGTSDGEELAGLGGDDALWGYGGSDTLLGGEGADQLRGDTGDDVLIGGAGCDLLNGGGGADLFVLTDGDADTIGGFDVDEGDRVLLAIKALVLGDGTIDGSRLRTADVAGGAFRLYADLGGAGAFEKILTINDGAGLALEDVLANAIHVA